MIEALALLPAERVAAALAVVAAYLAACSAPLLHRRARRRWAEATPAGGQGVLVAYASQTGYAEQLGLRTARALQAGGLPIHLASFDRLRPDQLLAARQALFVVSTTGEGDPPDAAGRFVTKIMPAGPDLTRLRYGVLALGDSSYARFCGFGRELDAWLRRQGAVPLFDRVEVDRADPDALQSWSRRLGLMAGAEPSDWTDAGYRRWRLVERRLLNAGSPGEPLFLLAFEAGEGEARWEPGDLVDVRPPAPGPKPLAPRSYSIASVVADGRLELLVRQARRDDGTLGAASGWLTARAEVGALVELSVRTNRSFHPPDPGRPLVLIGNGTGLAGLRAHLKARAAAGLGRNWLVFGERTREHDFLLREEIEAWAASGVIGRLDLAFSRAQAERVYVQDRLRAAADPLRTWVEDGAAVYVSGSLAGMSAGVHAALSDVLGAETVERLADEGRYRRDVY